MKNENFTGSGENTAEITNLLRQTYAFVDEDVNYLSDNFSSFSLETYLAYLISKFTSTQIILPYKVPLTSYLMKSLINFNFGNYLYIQDAYFTDNFLFEPSFQDNRALILSAS